MASHIWVFDPFHWVFSEEKEGKERNYGELCTFSLLSYVSVMK
jgi:hypothetical protein